MQREITIKATVKPTGGSNSKAKIIAAITKELEDLKRFPLLTGVEAIEIEGISIGESNFGDCEETADVSLEEALTALTKALLDKHRI